MIIRKNNYLSRFWNASQSISIQKIENGKVVNLKNTNKKNLRHTFIEMLGNVPVVGEMICSENK